MIKKQYEPPFFKVSIVDIEDGLATSSATVNPGGTGNNPNVEDWEKEEDNEDFFFNT